MSHGLVVGPTLLFCGAVLVVTVGGEYVRRRTVVSALEPVEAEVLSAQVAEIASPPGVVYTPEVQFRYTYHGETYTSDRVVPSVLDRGLGESSARNVVDEYAEGTEVTAHVHPDHPEDAVLRTAVNPTSYVLLAFVGVVLLALGAAMVPL